jgi:hypothetical protein
VSIHEIGMKVTSWSDQGSRTQPPNRSKRSGQCFLRPQEDASFQCVSGWFVWPSTLGHGATLWSIWSFQMWHPWDHLSFTQELDPFFMARTWSWKAVTAPSFLQLHRPSSRAWLLTEAALHVTAPLSLWALLLLYRSVQVKFISMRCHHLPKHRFSVYTWEP